MIQNEGVRGPPGANRQTDADIGQGNGTPAQYPDQTSPVKFPQRSRSAAKHLGAPQALYDGRNRLGIVQQIASGWRAFNRRGDSLGVFPSKQEAIDSIARALRGTP